MLQVTRAERDGRQERMRHTALLTSAIINNAGFGAPDDPVKPRDLAPWAFPGDEKPGMTKERFRENMERHEKRLEREQANA